jgi:hypothetical protein
MHWLCTLALLASTALPGAAGANPFGESERQEESTQPRAEKQLEQEKVDVDATKRKRKARRALHSVRPRISRYLTKAAALSDEGDPGQGMATLSKLNLKRLNPMERAMVYRLLAYLAYASGDFDGTISNFRKVVGEAIMPVDAEIKIRFNIAQLLATLQRWQDSIDAIHDWSRWVAEPDPLAYYLLGIAHFQLNEIDESIAWTEKAVDSVEEPKEGWLQLLAALFVQKEDYASATPVLEEMVMRFPKKQYWVQLSLIYGALDNYRHSLAVQQVAYMQGFLIEDKALRRLARSYLYHDLPYPAAGVLEKGLEDGAIEADAESFELLANSWIAAREFERSLPPLERAAELAEDGNLYVRLGQVQLQREGWNEATNWLEKAIAKGSLKSPGNARLLLGIAYYNADRRAKARSSFQQASKHDATREEAERWIMHIDNEEAQAS